MLSDSERRTVRQIEGHLFSDREFARTVIPIADRLRGLAAPVVVGVTTGTGTASRAVEWAAAEAAALSCTLRLVHVLRPPAGLDHLGMFPGCRDLRVPDVRGVQALEVAAARARSTAPGVQVTPHLVRGCLGQALLRQTGDARLLVLGCRSTGRPRGVPRGVRGPLAARVSAAARCPVAVVHPDDGAPLSDPPALSVVVGVGGTHRSDAALGFALRAAHQRGLGVTAVHAWAADRPADLEAVSGPVITSELAAYDLLHASLDRWRTHYPDVPVTARVVQQDAVSALVDGSAGAALVVVGSRGRGPARGAVFGSVSRAVVERVHAPVAVVPPAAAGRRAPLGLRR